MKLASTSFIYPSAPADRQRWITSYRGEKNAVDPTRPYAFLLEDERGPTGDMLPTATLFLTNRECPWRCLMCDLWKNTTNETVPQDAIPNQIRHALRHLPPARQVKLYNSGSFFDPNAIPPGDLPTIARLVADYERVIVECHPSLIGPTAIDFARQLTGQLEIAIGLETAHTDALDKLNKRMTLEHFSRAAHFLRNAAIDLRVFLLVGAPFIKPADAAPWIRHSIDFALNAGATVVSLIPTRHGNGALEELARQNLFHEPTLSMLEDAHDYGVSLARARIFADLWDLRRFSKCDRCFPARQERLHRINCEQRVLPRISCACQT